jgi:hypothetical protein
MFQLVLMLGHPWLTRRFVYGTADQIENNFVPSLFLIYVILFLDIHINFWVSS